MLIISVLNCIQFYMMFSEKYKNGLGKSGPILTNILRKFWKSTSPSRERRKWNLGKNYRGWDIERIFKCYLGLWV